jgi:hypothetical protein
MERHDIHDFLVSSQRRIEEEYVRITRRAAEDPGTAGDQGEENWAELLRKWLPSYFQIVTKGRILFTSGQASPQVDVLVLRPSYPNIMIDKKHYLSDGVVAAFECKTTLKSQHVKEAVETASEIRRNLPKRLGSPYRELNSTVIYGLLAHSHSWKGLASDPQGNIEKALLEAEANYVHHPIEFLDFLTVSDLATWDIMKLAFVNPGIYPAELSVATQKYFVPNGAAYTSRSCFAIAQANQVMSFSPLGTLLLGLYSKLAWEFPDMRPLEEYFRKVGISGNGQGYMRPWGIEIYSEQIRNRVSHGGFTHTLFDEWFEIY